MTRAKKLLPTSQPARLARSPRSASAVGEERPSSRVRAFSRLRSSPLPTSRRTEIAPGASSISVVAASGSSRIAGRGPVNARSSSTQPSGVAQRSHCRPEDVSAITRTSRARVRTALESSRATLREGASWLASAPTPTNTGAGEAVASASAADSPAGSPAPGGAAPRARGGGGGGGGGGRRGGGRRRGAAGGGRGGGGGGATAAQR